MKLTTRVSITKSQIEKIRQKQIQKNPKKSTYFNSSKFQKDIRSQVRANRSKKNVALLERISGEVGITVENRKVLKELFGEKTVYRRVSGKQYSQKMTVNKISSLTNYKRLSKAVKQIGDGSFNLKRRVSRSGRYKEVKEYLPENATTSEILTALDRGEFYYENRETIIRHNDGDSKASRELERDYNRYTTEKRIRIIIDD